ncbi:MAG: ABC transporter permease [Micavibrio sp.]|nr:ABC transporter permease [Micavibrio sp.]|tara:strand:- start:670 stop:1902 length:1233 start_codon:yes stop_codon:yes gene_type:complete
MNAVSLAVASIRSRPLNAMLCIVSAVAGIALLCAVSLFSQSVTSGFARNAQGIDIIAGTKGSPLQLVLSSIYHADIPAGNIDMKDYEALKHNPHIRQAIPLALGDNYKGFRMVGTTSDYLKLYKAKFKDGRAFAAPFETVAGIDTGLKVGDKFAVSHGFSADSDDVHDFKLYTVTGVLKPTGTVLDKLLTTQVESVQELHAAHEEDHHAHEHDESEGEEEAEMALAHQVTSVLLKVRSPVDLMNLPRQINSQSNIMATVPSYEMARFMKSLGIGRQLIVVLGTGFVILSALILLASLASGLALRRYDLAVLRVLGASPTRLSATIIAEGLILSCVGSVIGIILGHLVAYTAVMSISGLRGVVLPETLLMLQTIDAGFLMLGLGAGLLASFVPSVLASRTDIAGLLARGLA